MTNDARTLVLLEGREEPDLRLLRAARRVGPHREIEVLRVRPLPERSIPTQAPAGPRIEPWQQMRAAAAFERNYLVGLARRALGHPAPVQVRFGEVVAETVAAVAESGAGLVVAPSRRGSLFRRGRDGRLARALPVPLMLVTAEEKTAAKTAARPAYQG